ncbi:MAG TPA: hypothetical protein VNT22_03070 [Baekduia sp.]|nr:hypothetical protein [Baekduia sp.]
MSTAFLNTATAGPAAQSPFSAALAQAGAKFQSRDGWEIATSFGDPAAEEQACATTVGWADVSHLGKLEIQGSAATLAGFHAAVGVTAPQAGIVAHGGSNRWLQLTPERAIVLCEPGDLPGLRETIGGAGVDLTSSLAGVTVIGPLARDTFSRFCALDLRERELAIDGLRPGSVARMPGLLLREGPERFTVLFGSAYAAYFWEVLSDAGSRLGGRPVGSEALNTAISKETQTNA